MAPEVGLEPTTTRLIPMNRDSTVEQGFSNPAGGFHPLDLALALHRGTSGRIRLGPDKRPRTVFPCEFNLSFISAIMIIQPSGEITGLTDVKLTSRIL